MNVLAPRLSWQVNREAGFGLIDARLCQAWRPGPSAEAPGPHLLSVNEYRPHRMAEIRSISRLSEELTSLLLQIDEAVGIVTAYQPVGRITYSLSVWKSEAALRELTLCPLHRRVMSEYRDRGYLRHIHWWGTLTTLGAGMGEATRRLDAGEGRRVGEARDRWARRDQRRLRALAHD